MAHHRTDKAGRTTAEEIVQRPDVELHTLTDTGIFPNSEAFPLLIYRQALNPDAPDLVEQVRNLFAGNHWGRPWVNGVYDFHHYHSTAHEALAVCGGQAEIRFGGEQGITETVSVGDVIIIPAGVAHKNISASDGFIVVGAYPQGQDYDVCYGREGERPDADRNIADVPIPDSDPIYGPDGPLMVYWSA